MKGKKLTENEKDMIVKDYLDGIVVKPTMCKKYGVSDDRVGQILKAKNIKRNRSLQGLRDPRKKKIYDFFNDKMNPTLAYVIGFVSADGCLSDNSLYIRLSVKDEEFLKGFVKLFDPSPKFYYYRNGNFDFIGYKMSNILIVNLIKSRFCLEGNKTRSIEFPFEALKSKKLISCYILGVWDGDGSISQEIISDTSLKVSLVSGSKKYIDSLREILIDEGIDLNFYTKEPYSKEINGSVQNFKESYSLNGGSSKARKTCEYLYKYLDDIGFCMKRKLDKYNRCIEKREEKGLEV